MWTEILKKGLQCMLCLNFRTHKKKFTYDVLSGIATCLLDGTVFEIVKGLEDIQQLSERNLLNKRMKIVNSQKGNFIENNNYCIKFISYQNRLHDHDVNDTIIRRLAWSIKD